MIKQVMEGKGISQADLSRLIDMDKGQLSKLLSEDLRTANQETIRRIANALGISILAIFPGVCDYCGFVKCNCKSN